MSISLKDYFISQKLPPSINDENVNQLAQVSDHFLHKIDALILKLLIYPNVDNLDEDLINYLGFQMHVENFDTSLPLASKRELVKSSIEIHRLKGTKYAVEKTLKMFFGYSHIDEWFEYNGDPYLFKVEVGEFRQNSSGLDELYKAIDGVKNVRSALDSFQFDITPRKQSDDDYTYYDNNKVKHYLGTLFAKIGFNQYPFGGGADRVSTKRFFGSNFITVGNTSSNITEKLLYKPLYKYVGAYLQQAGNFTFLCDPEDLSQIDKLSTAMVGVLIVDKAMVREGELQVEIIPVEELYNNKEYFGGGSVVFNEIQHNPQILDKQIKPLNVGSAMAILGFKTYYPTKENVYRYTTDRFFGGLNAIIGDFKYINGDKAKAPEIIHVNDIQIYRMAEMFGGGSYQRSIHTMKPSTVDIYRDDGSFVGAAKITLGSKTYLNGDVPDSPPQPWIIKREQIYRAAEHFGGAYREFTHGQEISDYKQKEEYLFRSNILLTKADFTKLSMSPANDCADNTIGYIGGSLAFVQRIETYKKYKE